MASEQGETNNTLSMLASRQERLDQIAADILEKNICPDLAQTATQLVMGVGNLDAKVVLIGEAPGKQEDLTGEPFVGASGKFLDTMLESAGMNREDVYITNIVKYRPPSNRDPKKSEKEEFLPYLIRQIDLIDPEFVITLGRHSMDVLLPGMKISEVHGQVFEAALEKLPKVNLIPLYHPAAALYNPKMRPVLIDDFIKMSMKLTK